MPTYTLKNTDTNEEWDVFCSYSKLQEMLKENSNYQTVHKSVSLVSGTNDTLSKTPDGFRDVLHKMKSGAGRNNTIKIK